jgi:hypothetical protein
MSSDELIIYISVKGEGPDVADKYQLCYCPLCRTTERKITITNSMTTGGFMNIPAFAQTIICEFFYQESGQYYHCPFDKPRQIISEEEFSLLTRDYTENDQKYMAINDQYITFMKEKWNAMPQKINIEYLEFYYEIGILQEEDYKRFQLLYSRYKKFS